MDHQRTEIYAARQAVLEGEDLKDRVGTMISNVADRQSLTYEGDAEGFAEWVERNFGVTVEPDAAEAAVREEKPDLEPTLEPIDRCYEERREGWGDELTRRIESYLVLTAIDQKWKDHLHAMDALKAGIGLRGYGQQDPKIAYKKEATELFAQNLLPAIEADVTSKIMRIEVSRPEGEGDEAAGDDLAPRGIAPSRQMPQGQAPQRQVRFDELPLEQQRKVIEQLPDEQKLMAVMQAGEANQETLLGELEPALQERFDEVKRQLEERRAQQLQQQQAMRQAQRGPAASAAFDVMRRRKAMEEQQRAQQQAAAGNDSEGEAASQGAAARPAPAQRPAAAATAQKSSALGPEFRDAGRNDPCPCGSGKKFKKCHGK
jgi:preprotein translocase subunit SecA